jgi:dihydrofolate reductase / thymidylate synthase
MKNYKRVFDMILCMDNKQGIGIFDKKTNIYKLPWLNKLDMIHFQNITTCTINPLKKNIVVSGYNTWLSLGKVLPKRYNVIIDSHITDPECTHEAMFIDTNYNLCDLYNMYTDAESIFIIGGKKIYEKYISHPNLRYIFITHLNQDYNCNISMSNDFMKELNKYDYDVLGENDNMIFRKYNARSHSEFQYLDTLWDIQTNGILKKGRNGLVKSLFGKEFIFDLSKGFPLFTTKKVFARGIFEELKFFLLGQTDTKILSDKGVTIWNKNTTREFLDSRGLTDYQEGLMGPMYGHNFLHFGANYPATEKSGYNQFQYIIDTLKSDKHSRRLLMTSFDPSTVAKCVLYPCHGLIIQFFCNENKLNCAMYQRSMDIICGCPFNVASYALLMHIICNMVGDLTVGTLKIYCGDVHVYQEQTHINACNIHLERKPYEYCTIEINKKIVDIENLDWSDIKINNYQSHSAIKVNMIE